MNNSINEWILGINYTQERFNLQVLIFHIWTKLDDNKDNTVYLLYCAIVARQVTPWTSPSKPSALSCFSSSGDRFTLIHPQSLWHRGSQVVALVTSGENGWDSWTGLRGSLCPRTKLCWLCLELWPGLISITLLPPKLTSHWSHDPTYATLGAQCVLNHSNNVSCYFQGNWIEPMTCKGSCMVECTHTVLEGSNEMALPIYQMTALTAQRKQEIVKEFPGISLWWSSS